MNTLNNQAKAAKKQAPTKAQKKQVDPQNANRKVQRNAYLQTKLAVSEPGDAQEQEADRVADEVSRMPTGVARKAEPGAEPGHTGAR